MAGPDGLNDEKEIDGWVKEEKSLGSGGFGTVSLWVHKERGEKLAVKRCRMVSDMTAKHKERWRMEVEIMLRLSHPNVVAAMDLPSVLLRPDDELPPMAMEYCSGGDLRKVLIKPDNCTGLPEYMVRCILHDVGSGMEYLHSHRIIHRDLKPENIVLQKADFDDGKIGRKIVYKVIDLGYAKDLDQGSLCTSFVGTPQYLAPELLDSQPKYTCTVDYWSFGILAFEIIAGSRPFLPTKSPFQWHEHVRKKPDEVIHVYYDTRGEIVYSKQLPSPNHLCRTSQQDIQQWLRLMLMWNPKARGGQRNEQNRPLCFRMLEDFLNVKMIFVFCIYTNHLLSFKVKEDDTVHDLQLRLQAETKIAVAEQELLLNTGLSPDPSKPAKMYAADLKVEDEWLVYLFKKDSVEFPSKLLKRYLPDTVQSMIKDQKAMFTYPDQKRIWSHAVHFCQESSIEYRRLTYGQRAAMMALLRSTKALSNMKTKVSEEMTKLGAQAEFFQHSLTSDIAKYEEQASVGGVTSRKLHNSWQEMKEDVNRIYSLKVPVRELDEESNALSTKISELHKSPFSKTRRVTKLDETHTKAVALYAELKALSKEQRHGQVLDNRKMVNYLAACIQQRESDTLELYNHLSKIQSYRLELEHLLPRLDEVLAKVKESQQQLKQMQERKQDEVWFVLKQVIKQNSKTKSSPGNSILDTSSGSGSPSSMVNSYFEKSLEESLHILNENESTKSRLEEIMSSLVEEVPQSHTSLRSMDWDFLSNTKN